MSDSTENADAAVDALTQAARASRDTSSLQGNVVVLDAQVADEVMITADLHGNRENYDALLRCADLDANPRRHLILQEVCHGGPQTAEGGCMSHLMLLEVARLKVRYPDRVHFLMSNHELAELTDYPIVKGQRMLNLSFRCGMYETYGRAAESVREAVAEFLRSLPLAARLPGGVFVCHSTPENLATQPFDPRIFDRPLDASDFEQRSSLFNMVWGRDYREDNAQRFADLVDAKVLIHGHDPCPDGFKVPNRVQIIIDCCSQPAAYLLLPTDQQFTHSEIAERIQTLS